MNRPPKTPAEAVANIQELLADKSRWFGGDNRYIKPALGESRQQCVLTALDITAFIAPLVQARTAEILHDTLPKYAQQRNSKRQAIAIYNDSHTHATVMRWLRRAYATAEAQAQPAN